jgi:hypothetical protein
MARASTTGSTATTKKSIASMHSTLALLGGLGKIGTGFIARQLFRYVNLGELVSRGPLNFRERRENERSSGLSAETSRRGGREPDLLVPERRLCIVDAIEEQMSVKRRIVEILERQEEDS